MNKLKDYRVKAGLTQSELAQRARINVRTIQHYEQGVLSLNQASAMTVYKLSEAVGCRSMEELLNFDEK